MNLEKKIFLLQNFSIIILLLPAFNVAKTFLLLDSVVLGSGIGQTNYEGSLIYLTFVFDSLRWRNL